MEFKNVKLEIYTPEEYIVPLRDALHEVGAGQIGEYDHVMSYTHVQGSWRPLQDAQPYNGEIGEICTGTECRMDMAVPYERLEEALSIIHQIHPYEKPVIFVVPLLHDL